MEIIDAHQHFWNYDPQRHSWITPEMAAIRRDFLPEDLEPILKKHGVSGCMLVQVDQPEEHNTFLFTLAEAHDFIKGVVGWVNFLADDIDERLSHFTTFQKLKGFRYVLQSEADRAFMLQPSFMRGVRALEKYGFTYDILIYPDQLRYTREFVAAFPDQPFVIDHLAKPAIRDGALAEWKQAMQAFAPYEHVQCKISGMVTEANWQKWKKEDLLPYLDVVVETFGTNRIMFGSDWPVCLVAAQYEEVLGLVQDYFSSFSANEQARFFGGNATDFYNLGVKKT